MILTKLPEDIVKYIAIYLTDLLVYRNGKYILRIPKNDYRKNIANETIIHMLSNISILDTKKHITCAVFSVQMLVKCTPHYAIKPTFKFTVIYRLGDGVETLQLIKVAFNNKKSYKHDVKEFVKINEGKWLETSIREIKH